MDQKSILNFSYITIIIKFLVKKSHIKSIRVIISFVIIYFKSYKNYFNNIIVIITSKVTKYMRDYGILFYNI